MNSISYALIALIIPMMFVLWFIVTKLIDEKRKLKEIAQILVDIDNGNMNRRILAKSNDMTADICYRINQIVLNCEARLIKAQKAENANKQLMTSLSHDVKTPLTSLIAHLDAIHNGVVSGKEKDYYTEIARNKAYDLKEYIDVLFEWFKLNSNERLFQFEKTDVNELTRNIIVDWIPQFEKNNFQYEIDIKDEELLVNLDTSAYIRIINNIIQNAISHSRGTVIKMQIIQEDRNVIVRILDNGKGIPSRELPFIFDRLYKCDESRSMKGSGLGLSIVQELIKAHKGTIQVDSIPNDQTVFTISLPMNL